MDGRVYEDYARQLLPRAVGYSAGLINYFFRGKLGVASIPGGISVKNESPETMSAYLDSPTQQTVGRISVYYDTPVDPNHPDNPNRHLLASLNLIPPLDHLDPGQEAVIPFTLPTDNATPGRYIVVFQGKLGAEEGAVAGRVSQEHIYYVAENGDGLRQIFRMDPDWKNVTLVYNNLANSLDLGRLSVSPDGKTLVFAAGASPQASKLYLFDLASSPDASAAELTAGDAPQWSPDGTRIVFERGSGRYLPEGDVEIFTIDVGSRIETQLTNIPGSSASQRPSWSPDGNRIAYSRFNDPQEPNCANFYIIALMTPTGQNLGPVSCDPDAAYTDLSPAWRPDGEALVFVRSHPDPARNAPQLYRVEAGTKAVTKLTDSDGVGYDELWPVWSFDGTRIALGIEAGWRRRHLAGGPQWRRLSDQPDRRKFRY